MIHKLNKLSLFFVLLVILGLNSPGCSDFSNSFQSTDDIPPPHREITLTPVSKNIIYAIGWSDLLINANYAKTTVTVAAHFSTTRNACGKEAYGPIEMDAWNDLATHMNAAIKAGPSRNEYCVAAPLDGKYMDGTVEVKVNGATRTLYEFKDWQICSTIEDHKTSDALLALLNQLIILADKEDCPNGWGSA